MEPLVGAAPVQARAGAGPCRRSPAGIWNPCGEGRAESGESAQRSRFWWGPGPLDVAGCGRERSKAAGAGCLHAVEAFLGAAAASGRECCRFPAFLSPS